MGILTVVVSALLLLVALGVLWKSSRQYRLGRMVERNGGLDADIDAVRGKPYTFRFKDRIHTIAPMSVEQFMEVTSAVAHLGSLQNRKNTQDELIDAHAKLFRLACPTLTRVVVNEMNNQQMCTMFNCIL